MNEVEKEEYTKRAWQKDPPLKASSEQQMIYCIARAIYADFTEGNIEQAEAYRLKEALIFYFEMLESLAQSNSHIICELSKATAPRKKLGEKSKEELLEVIIRIEGVVTGLMKKYKDDIPNMLRLEG